MRTKDEMPACPVATTVQLIGSKWKLLIMRNLLKRPWRFNELRRDLDGISQKVLTDSLRSMEEDGIITRTVYPEVPRAERSGRVHAADHSGNGAVGHGIQKEPCRIGFGLSVRGGFHTLFAARKTAEKYTV